MRGLRAGLLPVIAMAVLGGCATAPASREARDDLIGRAAAALKDWDGNAPGIERFAQQGHGYALFPRIGKGGLGIGAAYGRGVVYEDGQHVGFADVATLSLGLQAGGQAYQVLLVFDDRNSLERFKAGRLEFSADATGVIAQSGFDAHVRFVEGAMIFSRPVGGLMGGSAMGGQRFTFEPRDRRRE